ncbi:hypothetical protein HID58_016495 [Brassica napus]|uniref:F-box associated beta-propeller type 1 domain-containing protein n=1 Tax=Brassica napus TaxID=3708 RepID=A0ABQ8DNF3_BRANA|nr:hypothetical protein HID58_016495 [Brassica napus]
MSYMYAYVTLPHHDQSEWYSQKCYRDGRRVVLASYDLNGPESFSFKEKLRKSAKGMNEAAEQWVSEVRRGTTKRGFAIRVVRQNLASILSSFVVSKVLRSCLGHRGDFVKYHATRPSMSCDGLVCTPEEECVNVLNPSTGQLQRFHSPPLVSRRTNSTFTNGTWTTYFPGYYAMGFGREKIKGHYKVVRISGDPNYSDTLDVSTLETTSLQACVKGTIYWLRIKSHGVKDSVYSILALDLHTEKFHYVKHPHLPKGIVLEAQIVNVGDRLLGIWTMDASQEETWSNTHSISLGIKPYVESRSFTPLSVSNQGNVVFYDDKKRLFKYYQDTDQLRPFSSDICAICPYLESLVPLKLQQVEFSTRVTCIRIRRPKDEIQSRRAGEFLHVGASLWKNKWIAMYLIMCCFGTRGAVFRAAMLLLVCLISRSGYLLYIIVVIMCSLLILNRSEALLYVIRCLSKLIEFDFA